MVRFFLIPQTRANALIRIEPILYQVVIKSEGRVPPKKHTTTSLQLHSFAKHVRHLLLGYSVCGDEVSSYLSQCTHIHDLALWAHQTGTECADLLGKISLRRLSANLEQLLGPTLDFSHPLFSEVTHLEITNRCFSWEKWSGLALMPKLTHLALDFEFDPGVVEGVLGNCQVLQVLVLVYDLDTMLESNLTIVLSNLNDHRVVPHYMSKQSSSWEQGARGGLDFWTIAEIVAKHYLAANTNW